MSAIGNNINTTTFKSNIYSFILKKMNYPAASGWGINKEYFLFSRGKQRGIKPKEIKCFYKYEDKKH